MTTTFDIDELERALARSMTAPEDLEDQGFWTAARVIAAFPAMIAEIRELRAENARLREVLSFDCTALPGMEDAAIKRSMHIANDRGKKPRLPDPIAILEMCEDIARAALGEPQ